MSGMKWLRQVLAAGVFLLGTAGVGSAKPILQEDFSTQVPGKKGGQIVSHQKGFAYQGPGGHNLEAGSYVEYDLRNVPFSAHAGTVEFDVTRAEVNGAEALVSFADENRNGLFSLYVDWERLTDGILLRPRTPGTTFWITPAKDDFGNNAPEPWAHVDRNIGKGTTFHVAMTWGAAGIKLYVDGKALRGKPNDEAKFVANLSKAIKFVVGADISTKIPNGAWSMTRSLVGNVQLHDVQLAASELAQAIAPKGLNIYGFDHDAGAVAGFSGKLVGGNVVNLTMNGTPKAVGTFDLVHFPDVGSKITIDWRGWGVYLEKKSFFEEGEVDLRDVEGYEVFASHAPFEASPFESGMVALEPLAKLEAGQQIYTIEKAEADKPYYVTVAAVMRDGSRRPVIVPVSNQPLVETEPGLYTGSYKVGWGDRYPRAVAVGRLVSGANTTSYVAAKTFAIDSALTLAVASEPNELKADEKSVAKITVVVTDANGNAVPDHEVKFMLFTTSQYTGVVGGGAFAEQVGGKVNEISFGKTDIFGTVNATYVAGFAAKTAIIVARDMASNSTGTGWVKTFITATAQLELEPVLSSVAMNQGYEISVSSSDSWLTADGKSTARITALVTQNGIPVEGHSVDFSVSSGSGSIRIVKETTDKKGHARAVYTAGKKIGMVLVTATDLTVGISGSVQIELRSDAPAKIAVKIDPEKLPADGRSRADVNVVVTDINDNPNDGVEVEYAVVEGSGAIRDGKDLTNKNGESEAQFIAGRIPGRVSIEITVRSTVPTPEELVKVNEAALSATDFRFF